MVDTPSPANAGRLDALIVELTEEFDALPLTDRRRGRLAQQIRALEETRDAAAPL
jgi:hypothetical protein